MDLHSNTPDAEDSTGMWRASTEPEIARGPSVTGSSVAGLVAVADAELYTPAEAALILKLPESWLRYKVKKTEIPCTRPGAGRVIRFSRLDLLEIARMGRQQPREKGTSTSVPPTPRPKRPRHA